MNDILKKELHVFVHGQSARFRLMKYAILIPLFGFIYWRFGMHGMLLMLVSLSLLGIAIHFLLRYKTKGWTEDWGPYKSLFKK